MHVTAPQLADPPPAQPAADRSLHGRALRNAGLAFVRYGGAQAVRLIGNLVLTRLLFAEAFGLMALVAVLLQALQMFSDVGIRQSIVRSARGDDPAFLDTAWTLQVVRGVGQWLVACACAVPFARFYGEPLLVQMVPVVGMAAVVAGFASTKQYTLDRDMRLGRLVIMELSSQAAGTLAMVALALLWRSVWALVAGSLLTSAVRTTLSFALLPGRANRFRWQGGARAELFEFGRWVFVSTMLTFASQAADRLMFGKLLGVELLGIYSIGRMMAAAPIEAIAQIGSSVMFPLFSRLVQTGRSLRAEFARVRRPLLVLAGWSLALLAAGGADLMAVLYDERYLKAGFVLQVLAAGAWFSALCSLNVAALLALGASRWMAIASAVKAAALLAAIPAGAYLAGFHGAVLGIAAAELLQWAFATTIVARLGLTTFARDLPLTALFLLSSAAGFAAGRAGGLPGVLALLVACAAVTLCWLPVAWPLLRSLRGRAVPLPV